VTSRTRPSARLPSGVQLARGKVVAFGCDRNDGDGVRLGEWG
jgi:hypothetical protein